MPEMQEQFLAGHLTVKGGHCTQAAKTSQFNRAFPSPRWGEGAEGG
jgi:hypothetical protein